MDKGSDQLAFHHYPLQLVLIWAAMGDFLVFSDLVSSSLSCAATGAAAANCSLTEFAVDRWVIRHRPADGVEDQLSSTFLGFG